MLVEWARRRLRHDGLAVVVDAVRRITVHHCPHAHATPSRRSAVVTKEPRPRPR